MYMSYERSSPKRKRGKTGYAVVYEGRHQKKGECEEIGGALAM